MGPVVRPKGATLLASLSIAFIAGGGGVEPSWGLAALQNENRSWAANGPISKGVLTLANNTHERGDYHSGLCYLVGCCVPRDPLDFIAAHNFSTQIQIAKDLKIGQANMPKNVLNVWMSSHLVFSNARATVCVESHECSNRCSAVWIIAWRCSWIKDKCLRFLGPSLSGNREISISRLIRLYGHLISIENCISIAPQGSSPKTCKGGAIIKNPDLAYVVPDKFAAISADCDAATIGPNDEQIPRYDGGHIGAGINFRGSELNHGQCKTGEEIETEANGNFIGMTIDGNHVVVKGHSHIWNGLC
jgi:hypothetical protein